VLLPRTINGIQSAIKVGPPSTPRLHTGIDSTSSSLFGKADQRDMARPFDRDGQFPLMTKAITRNSARHDSAAFRQKIPQESDILEVNRRLVDTEPARLAPLKEPPSATTT
jgi:hypothetical protein